MSTNTFKYHVFAPMGRFQLDGTTVENKGKLILMEDEYLFTMLFFVIDINNFATLA